MIHGVRRLRVGMAETSTLAPVAPVRNNGQPVLRAAESARLVRRLPMTPSEARGMLGLPGRAEGTDA